MGIKKLSRETSQKNLIREIVVRNCDHPTADEIYTQAKQSIPKISLGTVYRILNEMEEAGEVREVAVPEGKSRFDHTVKPHAHFHCRICKNVIDVNLPEYNFSIHKDIDGNLVEEAQIMLTGICHNCRR